MIEIDKEGKKEVPCVFVGGRIITLKLYFF